MSQQTKAFFRTNGKKLQAGSFSILLAFMFLLGLLQMFSWPLDVAQAQSGHPLKKTETPLELKQKGYGLHLPSLLQVVFGFQDMEIVWDYFSISDDYNNFSKVSAMTADEAGHVWFGGYVTASPEHGTVHRLDPDGTWRPMFATTNATPVMDLAVDNDGYLWVAAGLEGAYKGEATATSPVTWQHYPIGDNDIRTVAVEGEHIWFGTGEGGAYRFTPESRTWLTYTASTHDLCGNTVHKIAVAGNGDIWFGTDENGLCKLDTGDQWTSYLTGTQVSDIAFDSEGNVWVAAPVAGVISISPQGISTTHSLVEIVQPSTIIVDSTGRKWIGSYGDGVAILSADNGDVQYHDTTYIDSLADNQVLDIVEAANGDIWVGHEATYPDYFVTSRGVTHISGVTLMVDSPVPVGVAATLTATVEYGSGVTYTWGFGDGSPVAMGAIVTHTYQAAGNYPVVVTASNSLGAVTATTTIQVGEPISGLLAVSSSPSELNDVTVFTATVTAGDPVSYTWDFGDGSPVANGSQASHVYSDIGSYTAVVIASNSFNVVTATTPVTITDVPIAGLAAANDGPATVGSAATFSATITAGTNVAYTWAFGDGETGGGAEIAHVFTEPGMYTAVLTASNSVNVVSATTLVTITDVPIAGLSASNDSPTIINNPTTFVASIVAGTNVSYTWDFGDGAAEEGIQTSHTYAAGGFYTAVVTASNSANWLTATTVVTVSEPLTGPDLIITKTGPSEVVAGALMIYDITVANQGGEPAANVIITDTLPVSTTFVDSSLEGSFFDENTGTVVWTIDFLSGGEAKTFTLQAQVNGDVPVSTSITNTVVAAFSGIDPTPEDNQDSHLSIISEPIPGPDLFVHKSGPSQIPIGFPIDYYITVANQGSQRANHIVVTDTLPASIRFISSTHDLLNTFYDSETGNVVWQIQSLAAGSSYDIILHAQVDENATQETVTNVVEGTIQELEENFGNNQASVSTTIIPAAPQLTITPDSSNPDPMTLMSPIGSGPVSRVITVTNSGTAPLIGDLTVSGVDYSWLTITPVTVTGGLAVGQFVTFTVAANPTGSDVTLYYDFIVIDSPEDNRIAPEPLYLEVYEHPILANFAVQVTNDMGETVPGAHVSLTKQETRSIYVDGNLVPNHPYSTVSKNKITDNNGMTVMNEVEVGDYDYTIWANGHRSISGTLTVSEGTTNFDPPPLLALPGLVFDPNQASMSILAGESTAYAFQIRNLGPGHAENFIVETPESIPWLSVGLPYSVTLLEAGQSMLVTLFLNPPYTDSLEVATYQDYVTVSADHVDDAILSMAIDVTPVQSGTLAFLIKDANDHPIEGANVTLVNQTGHTVNAPGSSYLVHDWYEMTTDVNGTTTLPDLPLSEYTYYVESDGFYHEIGSANVSPGEPNPTLGINQVAVSLNTNPFIYSWIVNPTEITDTYAITIQVRFESDVDLPALFVSPAYICPADETYNGEWLVANLGPVPLTNISLQDQYANFNFTYNHDIESLAPGESVSIPFTAVPVATPSSILPGGIYVSGNYQSETGDATTTASAQINSCWNSGGGSGVPGGPGGPGSGNWSCSPDLSDGVTCSTQDSTPPPFPGNPPPPPIPGTPTDFEASMLQLSGNATLLRQAFTADLLLVSTSTGGPYDFHVDINVVDDRNNHADVTDGFGILPEVPTDLGILTPTPGSQLNKKWILIPNELSITDTNGVPYWVHALISYYPVNDPTYVDSVTASDLIYVFPQPRVRLAYSHSQPNEDGTFYLEVTAVNEGYGVARSLTLDLSQVDNISLDDDDERSLVFSLITTTIDAVQQPSLSGYVFNFGDLEPGESKIGRWTVAVTTTDSLPLNDPVITGFRVACKHLDYRGLTLSSLIVDCGEIIQYTVYPNDCPFYNAGETIAVVGGPINTANGNYAYAQSMPAIPTVSDPLQFTWSYNSLNSGAYPDLPPFTSTLGLGWAHSYDTYLDLDGIAINLIKTVVFRSPHGSPILFEETATGYRAVNGANGTLIRSEIVPGQNVYTMTTTGQTVYVFDHFGKLLTQTDAHGNSINFTYNEAGQLTRALEPISGRFLDFTYDENDRLASVIDPLNRTTQFGYNSPGHLTTITDTRQQVWHYEYSLLSSGPYVLSRIQDPEGRIIEETGFDEWGRAITQTYKGQTINIAYYEDGRRVITDASGRETTHVYNNQGLLVAIQDADSQLERFVLDGNTYRIYNEDKNGNATHYARSSIGQTTAITNALGFTTSMKYDERGNLIQSTDARGQQIFYDYDEFNNLITVTNYLGNSSGYTYNDYGQIINVTDENAHTSGRLYDDIGQLVTITDTVGNATHYEYDIVGRLITTTDSFGQVTVNRYDASNNLIQVTNNYRAGYPQNYFDEFNIITQYAYDSVGRQVVVTDTLDLVTRNVYNDVGQLIQTIYNQHPFTATRNYLNEYNVVTAYEYDQVGNRIAMTDTVGNVTRWWFNDMNRVISATVNFINGVYDSAKSDEDLTTYYEYDAVGNIRALTNVLGHETRMEYDALNRLVKTIINYQDGIYDPNYSDEDLITSYVYDEAGNQTVVTDPLGRETHTTYDELGRVKSITNPLSGTVTYAYDAHGNLLSVTDAQEHITSYGYNALNRVVTTTNAVGDQTFVFYNDRGLPVTRTNANGFATVSVYDSLQRQIAETNPEGETTGYVYNARGNLVSLTDGEDNTTAFYYDSLNRLTQTTNSISGTTIITYDVLGNRLAEQDANGHVITYTYDKLNRLARQTDANNLTTAFAYDGLGRLTSVTNAAGETTEFEYDKAGRLRLVRDPMGHGTEYRYDAVGNRVAVIDAEGVETYYGYDALNRLVAVVENFNDGVFNSEITDEDVRTEYLYDEVGNLLSITNPLSVTTVYQYDALNRVIAVTDPLSHTIRYGYDPVGNRTVITDANQVTVSYSYDGANRLTGIDFPEPEADVTLQYDRAGNLITMTDGIGITYFTYDDLYRLDTVLDSSGQVVTYTYDAVGNLHSLTYPDGKAVTYTYDVANRLQAVTDWSGGVYAYQYDDANRPTQITQSGLITTAYQYDPAGRLVNLSHLSTNELLANYSYGLDGVGYRRTATETMLIPETTITTTAFAETGGLLVIEAEAGQTFTGGSDHEWISQTTWTGYGGEAYLRALPDNGTRYESHEVADAAGVSYAIVVNSPATYTLWVRGMAPDAAGDSLHAGINGQVGEHAARLTGFAPDEWTWSRMTMSGTAATLSFAEPGVYTLNVWMREDGLRLDRLLLITDTTYIPAGIGPSASAQQVITGFVATEQITQVIAYDYDPLYRLTAADYADGSYFHYKGYG